ncbi:hypothetical protein BDP27DRAFT_1219048 [Rhodocollybia butyracea]|uniref:DUF202 domain-containing protein n=1 Tax=Rhodocollybia butyracea TaxID=206335 RepID=A0A9P5UA06_9AGAR|nr:hypothetical protein BDP27DRAFT_1219048 [Rhodocollybia butyracea]
MQALVVQNVGSTARDYLFLERNFLSHLKLALLFSVLSSSLLLHARLVPDSGEHSSGSSVNLPLAGLQFAAAMLAIFGGLWEYLVGYRDFFDMRPFNVAGTMPHLAAMVAIIAIILVTCVVLLADNKL